MGFEDVAGQIDAWVAEGAVQGAAISVWHRGDLVTTRYAGEAKAGVPVNDSTLFGLASLSKPIATAAIMSVVDEGLLDLDGGIIDVLPEFGAEIDILTANAMLEPERDRITLRHLLSHMSGLPENFTATLFEHTPLPSRDEQIDAMLQTPLTSAPGERLRYSNVSIGVASRAAEAVTAKDILTLTNERVLRPMELRNIVLAPGNQYDDRIATLQDPAAKGTERESYNSPWWRSLGLPWGGFYAATDDMVRFAASFLPGQTSPLSDGSKREMVTDQVRGAEGGVESMHTIWNPGFWGLGWEVKGSKPRHWSGNKTSPHTWVHWGFAGTLAWMDPQRELGVAVFANRSVTSGWMFRPARWTALSDALCDVADGRIDCG